MTNEIEKYIKTLRQPAIILGNGLNLENNTSSIKSWTHLLQDVGNEFVPKEIFPLKEKDNKCVSYPEWFDWILLNIQNGKNCNLQKQENEVKRYISKLVLEWNTSKIQQDFVLHCQKDNIPVLTTNYDLLLLQKDNPAMFGSRVKEGIVMPKNIISPGKWLYPFSFYYSNLQLQAFNICNSFAIWHMHGMASYPTSQRISMRDYENLIKKCSSYLQNLPQDFHRPDSVFNNSWLKIFFTNNLIFAGIGLDRSETFIRWLIVERARFYKNQHKEIPKSYLILHPKFDEKNHDDAEKEYFKSLGIETILLEKGTKLSDCFKN